MDDARGDGCIIVGRVKIFHRRPDTDELFQNCAVAQLFTIMYIQQPLVMGNFADCKFLIVHGCMVGYSSLFLDFMVIPVVSVSQAAQQTILHSSTQASHRSRSLSDFTVHFDCPPELIAPKCPYLVSWFANFVQLCKSLAIKILLYTDDFDIDLSDNND